MNDYCCVGWHLVPAGDGGLQYHFSSEPFGYSSSPVTLWSPMVFLPLRTANQSDLNCLIHTKWCSSCLKVMHHEKAFQEKLMHLFFSFFQIHVSIFPLLLSGPKEPCKVWGVILGQSISRSWKDIILSVGSIGKKIFQLWCDLRMEFQAD